MKSYLVKITGPLVMLFLLAATTYARMGLDTMNSAKDESGKSKKVHFKDDNLKKIVESSLGIVDPNMTDMLHLNDLYASWEPIEDLSGLETALNLETLDISYTDVEDLSPILTLEKLSVLNVSGSRIKNWRDIRKIQNLTCFKANQCQLTNIAFIKGIVSLEALELNENEIANLTPLKSLENLKFLELNQNKIVDIVSLKQLGELESLLLVNNRIENISPLSSLSKLTALSLVKNAISDISGMESMRSLILVNLSYNPLNENSLYRILPKVYQNQKKNSYYFDYLCFADQRTYESPEDISGYGEPNEYVISNMNAALSEDGRYIAIVAGKREKVGKSSLRSKWDDLSFHTRAFVIDVEKKEWNARSVPSSFGVSFLSRQLAWRPQSTVNELLVHMDGLFYISPSCMQLYSIRRTGAPEEVVNKFSIPNKLFSRETNISWTINGLYLLGRTSIPGKEMVLVESKNEGFRFLNIPSMDQNCWIDSATLYGTDRSHLYRVYLLGNQVKYERIKMLNDPGEHKICLGGITSKKPVYCWHKYLYVGEKLLYTAEDTITNLLVDNNLIALQDKDNIYVIDTEGKIVFHKSTDLSLRLLALSGERKVLYLLKKQQVIESCDISTAQIEQVCDVSDIVAALERRE